MRALRRQAYEGDAARDVDVIDDYSSHVIARRGDRLVGAIRVTCRVDGSLESESAYPAWLLAEFGDVMCACSRLCVIPGMAGTRVPYQLIRRAWQHVIVRGVRLDVSKVRRRAIPDYLRLGGYFLRGSLFTFDRWQVECGLVAFPVHPAADSPFVELFDVPNPCELAIAYHRDRFTRDPAELRRAPGPSTTAAQLLEPSLV